MIPLNMSEDNETRTPPNIFDYQEYRKFIRDWFEYKKQLNKNFSVRNFSKRVGIANGYLTRVIKGNRRLSEDLFNKLCTHIGLNSDEVAYLQLLRGLCDTKKTPDRIKAIDRLKKFRKHNNLSIEEIDEYQYLEKWYFVAIRELANTKDFKFDPMWIKERLRAKISLGEIQEALQFLLERGYIQKGEDGAVSRTKRQMNCIGAIYRIALRKFHQTMLKITGEALDEVPVNERLVAGYTTALPKAKYKKVQSIIDKALCEIAEETKDVVAPGDAEVYHVSLAVVPLTGQRKRGGVE